ncbi:MAG: DUF3180 domain-containing protein [Nocardioides sp.]|uniref:DUF3180 domain-containing protein n=1 Tax=Nocardioides sp. TaxID=35761 RepID=UPI003F0C2823
MNDEQPEHHGAHRLRPLPASALSVLGVLGLVGGWVLRRAVERWGDHAPLLTWGQPLALLLAACALGGVAWWTWRRVHVQGEWLEPRLAVNRLVLARASALVGALVTGGYAGLGISWLGDESSLAGEQLTRAGLATLAGGLVLVAALLLERACRARSQQ